MSKNPYVLALTLILLVIISLQTPVVSQTKILVSSINMYLLAVTRTSHGVVVNVTMESYYPGSGEIDIIEHGGRIAGDTVSSIKYALRIASLMTGIDYKIYDYKVIFPSNAELSGTSATLAFILGFISLLRRQSISPKIGITGVIAPNLVVGNVSGINAKYYAAISYGLNYVIGPPNNVVLGKKKYIYVADAYNAYKYYAGQELLPIILNIDIKKNMLDNVFIKSYNYFKYKIDTLIKNYNKILGKTHSNMTVNGTKEYLNAVKYFRKENYYTAASYMFRAFIDISSSIYMWRIERDKTIINKLIKWGMGNKSLTDKLMENLHDKLEKYPNLWNLDIYLNTYIRYKQAITYLEYANKSKILPEKIKLYMIGIARFATARHWGLLLINTTGERLLEDKDKVLSRIEDYFFYTLEYLSYMRYIGNDTINYYYSLINSNASLLDKIISLGYFFYTLNYNLSLYRGLYDLFITPKVVLQLNNTLYGLGLLLATRTGYMPATTITLLELIRNYMFENETLYSLGILGYMGLAILVYELLLTPYTMVSSTNTSIAAPTIYSSKYLRSDILPVIIVLAIGVFMAGYISGWIRAMRRISGGSQRESSAYALHPLQNPYEETREDLSAS
jgi:uncharacterized protein